MQSSTNKMAVGLTSFNNAIDLFQQHYFLQDGNTGFKGQDIIIPLQGLQDAVDSFMNKTGTGNPNDVALCMVLCYDANNSELYLRIQLCLIQETTPGNYSVNTQNSIWYSVSSQGMNQTGDESTMDAVYFDNFWYCLTQNQCDPNQLVPLSDGTDRFVNNQVMPWGLEILQMISANPTGVSIAFTATSYTGNPTAAVDYPHCITLSLLDDNSNRLVDDNVYQNTFTMKAADFNTMCPNCCNCYKLPA